MIRSIFNRQAIAPPVFVTVLLVAGCLGETHEFATITELRRPSSGPTLVLTDSIVLGESDSIFVGPPGSNFAVDPRGTIYIPDESIDAVLEYGSNGNLHRIIGRKGSGPGELRGVGASIEAGQSFLAVRGYRNLNVTVFDVPSGGFIGSFKYRGYLSALAEDNGSLWYGTMDLEAGKVLGSIDPIRAARASKSPWLEGKMVDVPEEFGTFPGLDIFNNSNLVFLGDSLLLGFGGLNPLLLVTRLGTILDTIDLPVWKRRGVSLKTLEEVFRTRRRRPPEETFAAISSLAGLWRTHDGRVLVYHRDLAVAEPGVSNSPVIGRAYISVLSADLARACVDGEIVFPEPTYPVIDVQHDTVYVLDQNLLPGAPSRAQTVVRKYVVDDSNCGWVDLR